MNTKNIETLIGRYFNGETNLHEEQKLRDFFSHDSLPEHLVHLKPLFAISSDSFPKLESSFENDFFQKIDEKQRAERKLKFRRNITWISGTAASILLLISLLTFLRPAKFEDSFNDPVTAYKTISTALFFVSEKMNEGLQPVRKANSTLEKGVIEINRLKKIDEGAEQASKIKKIDEIRNYFSFR